MQLNFDKLMDTENIHELKENINFETEKLKLSYFLSMLGSCWIMLARTINIKDDENKIRREELEKRLKT